MSIRIQHLISKKIRKGATTLLMFVGVITIVCAYCVREGLIISIGQVFGLRGDEVEVYATGVIVTVLVVIVPVIRTTRSLAGAAA